jgi:hypothetical protein
MRKLSPLAAAICLAPLLLVAETYDRNSWHFLTETNDGTLRRAFYVNRTAIVEVDGYRRVWVLLSNEPSTKGIKSLLNLTEVDCGQGRNRILDIKAYEGDMGGGRSVKLSGSDSVYPTRWEYAAPDTVAAKVNHAACEPRLEAPARSPATGQSSQVPEIKSRLDRQQIDDAVLGLCNIVRLKSQQVMRLRQQGLSRSELEGILRTPQLGEGGWGLVNEMIGETLLVPVQIELLDKERVIKEFSESKHQSCLASAV